MKRVVGFVLVVVLAAAAGAGGYAWWRQHDEADGDAPLTLYGNVDIRDAQLAFNGEEHIRDVLVEEGDTVHAGQALARLRTDRLEAEIARTKAEIQAQADVVRRLRNGSRPQEIDKAQANVEAAEAQVENVQQRVDRLRDTSQRGASSAQDLDDALAELRVAQAERNVRQQELALVQEGPREEEIAEAQARLEALRAGLELLNDRLADATLTAPADGVIQSRILEPGEFATPTRPVLTLALTDPKWVRAYVAEPELGRVAEGQRAEVRADSLGGRTVRGWIGFISPTAEFTPKSVQTEDLRTRLVYEVRVYVNDPENELRLGQPVTVTVLSKDAGVSTRPAR